MTNLMPVLFVPHGGGPMPLMGESNHQELIQFLSSVGESLPRPKAILMVTAHWEEDIVTVSSKADPKLLFDYYGFPPETYRFSYSAAGNPTLAGRVVALLSAASITSRLDDRRDFDHGTFVPLMLMYPKADIPVVQMSLVNSLNPAEHVRIGKSLASLREEGVLIVGSGMSFHNMQAFFSGNPAVTAKSQKFDDWLACTLVDPAMRQDEKQLRMSHW